AKEAERLAAEQAEKDRLAKEEAERLAAEEKARQEKLASLVAIAKEAGLTDSQAMQVAKNNMTSSEDQFIQAIETFKIDSAKGFSSNTYRQGFNHLNYSASSSASNRCVNSVCTSWSGTTTTGKTLYNQKYSVVSGDYSARQGLLNGSWIDESSFSNIQIKGLKTQENAVPNEGSAIYLGKAFKGQTAGELTYNVNFATRIGSGSISGLPVGQVTLGEANINGTALSGEATAGYGGGYSLEFFGPKAEEVGGTMYLGADDMYGLSGTRGEIQK
ncbi:factor H binding protein domain-containing protein, partial [Glaesserella parasuis]